MEVIMPHLRFRAEVGLLKLAKFSNTLSEVCSNHNLEVTVSKEDDSDWTCFNYVVDLYGTTTNLEQAKAELIAKFG